MPALRLAEGPIVVNAEEAAAFAQQIEKVRLTTWKGGAELAVKGGHVMQNALAATWGVWPCHAAGKKFLPALSRWQRLGERGGWCSQHFGPLRQRRRRLAAAAAAARQPGFIAASPAAARQPRRLSSKAAAPRQPGCVAAAAAARGGGRSATNQAAPQQPRGRIPTTAAAAPRQPSGRVAATARTAP